MGDDLDLNPKQIGGLMSRLMNSHMGNGPNRVSYNDTDEKWTISPPLHYSLEASLPAHKTLVDRRDLSKLRSDSKELAELRAQTVSKSSKKQQQRAAKRQRPANLATGMSTARPPLVRVVIEQALEPPASVLNAKVTRTQEARSMVVSSMVANPAMSARQYGPVFMKANAAARSVLSGMGIDQVDSSSRESAVRSLAGLSERQLENISYAIGCLGSIDEEEAAELQESNTQHLDAALVSATPSKQTITDWTLKENEIRESLMREQNKNSGAHDHSYVLTDKGGKQDLNSSMFAKSIGTRNRMLLRQHYLRASSQAGLRRAIKVQLIMHSGLLALAPHLAIAPIRLVMSSRGCCFSSVPPTPSTSGLAAGFTY